MRNAPSPRPSPTRGEGAHRDCGTVATRRLPRSSELHPEQLGVARLDLLARPLDPGRIVLELLDLRERPAAGLFLGLRVHRAQAADVDQGLLALYREAI